MSIRLKLTAGFALMLVFLMINSILLIFSSNDSSKSFQEISNSSAVIGDKVLPLISITHELRVNVIQVQQWLTDISATRGLNGLNDGFDEAEAQARAFNDNMTNALKLTEELGQPALTQALENMQKAFSPYYETGVKMATAYVAEGPVGGNKMMGDFDEVAAKIQAGVSDVALKVEKLISQNLDMNSTLLESSKSKTETSRNIAYIPVIVSIVVGFFAIIGVLGICKNLTQMTTTMHSLSHGKLDVEVPGQDRSDELGDMADSVETFKKSEIENRKLVKEREESEIRMKKERRKAIEELADDLDHRVSGSMKRITDVLHKLEEMAEQMTSAANSTTVQSQAVSAATEQTSVNMEAVSSSGAELSASINEISHQVTQSSDIAKGAVEEAQKTTKTISSLADEVSSIENVVQLITDIAEQTNLLALNATIESARAGEAGKGFAVVASEVKNLAQQTAKATEEIGAQIGKVQSRTSGSVSAIEGIAKTISHLNEYSSSVAAAVEQQSAATQEIAHNVNEAARGAEEISSNISGVAQAAGETGHLANDVSQAAHDVKEASQELRNQVQEFLDDIRDGSSGRFRY